MTASKYYFEQLSLSRMLVCKRMPYGRMRNEQYRRRAICLQITCLVPPHSANYLHKETIVVMFLCRLLLLARLLAYLPACCAVTSFLIYCLGCGCLVFYFNFASAEGNKKKTFIRQPDGLCNFLK